MKTTLSISLGIIVGTFAAGLYAAPPPAAVTPPPGGTIAPGAVGGQIAPGTGGTLTPGSILTAPPIAGPPAGTTIPGGSLYLGSNGVVGNPPLNKAITTPNSTLNATAPPGGTLGSGGVGGTYHNGVFTPSSSSGAPGGVIVGTTPAGGSASGVIVAGGTTSASGTGGTFTNNAFPKAVIVTGGSH